MNGERPPPATSRRESELLAAARRGDEGAFERLLAPYRGELQAHAYRMLGSLHDAEDAMQEAMLRAWRGIGRFEGRSSLRSWLYTIATNACLRLIERRPKRVLPIDFGPPADPHGALSEPLVESVWIEPFPDERLASDETEASPAARYEQRESVELAFTAALQRLPGLQRAALIMTDVLGFSPAEVAEALDTTPTAIYGALQRARRATEEQLPNETQQKRLDQIGEDRVRKIVDRFVEAWEAADAGRISTLLTDDCVLAMPPWREWFCGREAIAEFLPRGPFRPGRRWKLIPTQANGQSAFGSYWTDGEGAAHAEAIMVLTLTSDGRISAITPFRSPELFSSFGLPRAMDPEGRQQPHNPQPGQERNTA
jgi:RNA polymerase sigma-70 factor (ECF subfamily)